jgi:hypothetical protein
MRFAMLFVELGCGQRDLMFQCKSFELFTIPADDIKCPVTEKEFVA